MKHLVKLGKQWYFCALILESRYSLSGQLMQHLIKFQLSKFSLKTQCNFDYLNAAVYIEAEAMFILNVWREFSS